MRKLQKIILLVLVAGYFSAAAQTPPLTSTPASFTSREQFFLDEKLVEMTILTDFKNMEAQKQKGVYQNATVSLRFPDSAEIKQDIKLYARGEYRRKYCQMPGIMLNFKGAVAAQLGGMKKIKLVCACNTSVYDGQLLLTEYLIYKIYNLLTDMSFKTRLTKVTYQDSHNKMKTYTQYGFLIEDINDLAERNNCKVVKNRTFLTEQTDRAQMTMVSIFEYMIGNTDWAVPVYHNIRLMRPIADSTARPYAIPYDFDFAGLVNAPYAIPAPELGIEKVTDRLYRGFPRNMEELQIVLDVYRKQKDNILSLIDHFDLIDKKDRKVLLKYIEDFYDIISNKNTVKATFIDGARRS